MTPLLHQSRQHAVHQLQLYTYNSDPLATTSARACVQPSHGLSGFLCQTTGQSGNLIFRVAQVARGFLLTPWVQSLGDRRLAKLEEIMTLMADKVIDPHNGKSFDLSQAAEAVQEAQKEARGGKVFLKG